MKKCPWCAEDIQDEARICRYCQRPIVAEVEVTAVISAGQPMYRLTDEEPSGTSSVTDKGCPTCRSRNVRRCEVVYQEGTTSGTGVILGAGHAFGGHTAVGGAMTTNQSTTVLAERIAPPQKRPESPTMLVTNLKGLFLGAFSFVFLLVLMFTGLIDEDSMGATEGILLFVIPFVLALAYMVIPHRIAENIAWNANEFPALWNEYQRSWVCLKCGNVFTT